MINVFIIGARGYTKRYGGWETLVHGLVDNQQKQDVHYYIYEVVNKKNEEGVEEIDGITCVKRYTKDMGGLTMILSDMKAFTHAVKMIKKRKIENPVILYLGARFGPIQWLLTPYYKSAGVIIMENPAGVEWKRPKWGLIGEIYSFISCYFTAIASDYIVCDSEGIRDIYKKMVKSNRHRKEFVAYGSYPAKPLDEVFPEKVKAYFNEHNIVPGEYYLIVNRFMPENSYELILNEFVKSETKKDFIIVSNIDKEHKYYDELASKIPFEKDKRIKFVGTMYDPEILNYLRQSAFAYINGHTLGGTNPGLLEAMATTGVVLAYDVVFSREVCGEYAFYYDKNQGHLMRDAMIQCEAISESEREQLIANSKQRMRDKYDWKDIARGYEDLFVTAVERRKKR